MNAPSRELTAWLGWATRIVALALVIILLANAYDGRTSAEQQVRDVRSASAKRINELLADNRAQAEQNARLREALAAIVAAHPGVTVPPDVTTTTPPPATVPPSTTTTTDKPD